MSLKIKCWRDYDFFIKNVFADVKKMKFIPIKIMLTSEACEAEIAKEAALSRGVQTRLNYGYSWYLL